jgi:SOS response associated peptidase (SRAP)
LSFKIITREANKLLRPIHDRMPLILDPLVAKQWLDPTFTSFRMLSVMLQSFPSELMEAYEVSRLVNDPKKRIASVHRARHSGTARSALRPMGLRRLNRYGYARIQGILHRRHGEGWCTVRERSSRIAFPYRIIIEMILKATQ